VVVAEEYQSRFQNQVKKKTNCTIVVLPTDVVSFLGVWPSTNELALKEWMRYHKQPVLNL
jgi:hypothetical protein